MIGPEWTTPLAAAAAALILAAIAGVLLRPVKRALLESGGSGTAAVLAVLLALAAGLYLRPGEDTFTGLDVSAYRLMSRSFAEGRPLHGIDEALRELPRPVRSLVLYRPEHHKTTRSQSFRLDSLDTCAYRPFYYPLLPLAAAGFDKLTPGKGKDLLPGSVGLAFTAALLLFAVRVLGPAGAAPVFFFAAGTAFPAWFFRGFFPEAVGSALIGMALISWLGEESGREASAGRSLALGLALSLHPVLAVYAFPFFIIMNAGAGRRGFAAGLLQLAAFSAGALPLFLQTRYVTAPYGTLSIGSLRHGMQASPAIRAVLLAAAGLVILSALIFAFRRRLVPVGGTQGVPRAGRIGIALLWVLPTAVALGAEGGEAARAGAAELVRGTGLPWLLPAAGSAAYAFVGKNLGRVRIAGAVVAASLPLFLFLKGWEDGGLWSQRRLLPPLVCFMALLLPAAAAAMNDLRRRWGSRAAAGAALVLIACGLAGPLRWPAPYLVREEKGADAWVQGVADRYAGATVFFDYHPYSVPFADLDGGRFFGLGPYAQDRLGELAPFVYRQAKKTEIFWFTPWSSPGLEGGVSLVGRGREVASLPAVRARTVFPAVRGEKTIALNVLEAVPLRRGAAPPPVDKIMDRGPLALRPPWGRADIPIRRHDGSSLPARWSREGSGIVGPLPLPGGEVMVTIEGVSNRRGGEAVQTLLLEAPWGGPREALAIGPEPERAVVHMRRPEGGKAEKVRTGTYRLYAETPYDPSRVGIRGFNRDLGALIHRIRIELAPDSREAE